MEITIMKSTAEAVGLKKLVKYGIDLDDWQYKNKPTDRVGLLLSKLSRDDLAAFRKLIAANIDTEGTKVILRDIDSWTATLDEPGKQVPRTVKMFSAMLVDLLLKTPGHRVYETLQDGRVVAYYIKGVEYTPPHRKNGGYYPPFCTFSGSYRELAANRSQTWTFEEEHCRGMSVREALARQNLVPETHELRAAYLEETRRFDAVIGSVGRQFLAVGIGVADLDGNGPAGQDSERWSHWRPKPEFDFVRGGSPTRVVVDVFREGSDKVNDDRDASASSHFWRNLRRGYAPTLNEKVDKEEDWEDEDLDAEEAGEVVLPIHPSVPVFDLAKHLRCRTHVGNLTEYVYDPSIIDRLVLPPDTKALIRLLVEHKDAQFTDVIAGKSGGAVVLLSGPPGCGKTLTAEVYAESEGKALYSIQCSQLGTDAETMEKELLRCFARAKRWGAVMLLDEADVYVRERGGDLTQNAIVGVFLRVFEYQSSTLFLTTNRPQDVDDAVVSRCVARIGYEIPCPEDLKRLWEVLSKVSGIPIVNVDRIVLDHPRLSGRDVKQLLKLAKVASGDAPVDTDVIAFVRRFRPDAGDNPRGPLTKAQAAIAERLASRADAPKPDGGPRFRIKRTAGAPAGRIATSNSGADPC